MFEFGDVANEMVNFWSPDHHSILKSKKPLLAYPFERLFALALTARAIPSPEVGRSVAACAGRERDHLKSAHDL